jgi:hypothetical protein
LQMYHKNANFSFSLPICMNLNNFKIPSFWPALQVSV